MTDDDNPTLPLPRTEEQPEPQRRRWTRPALIAGAVVVALGNAVWNHEQGPAEAVALADRLLKQRGSLA